MLIQKRVLLLAMLVPTLMAPSPGGNAGAPFSFAIERNGVSVGFFETCRGLGSTSEVLEIREGGEPNLVRKLPGRLAAGNVICTRGLTAGTELNDWRKLVEEGKIAEARSTVTVTLFDSTLAPVSQWRLSGGWPSEVLALGTFAAALEAVTIVSENIQRISP